MNCNCPILQSIVFCLPILTLLSGCGQDATIETGQTRSAKHRSGTVQSEPVDGETGDSKMASGLPTVSIGRAVGVESTDPPEKGSPEWLLQEISRFRLHKFPQTDDPNKLRSQRRWRNEQIIKLAQETIAKTHDDPDQLSAFDSAVHYLMQARLELAVQVDSEQLESAQVHIQELYSDADALYQRAPKSKSAAEAAFVRVKFANISADRFADHDPRWLEEFSRQARLFADRFPQEHERAVSLLDAAGRSCELHRLREQAVDCYALLEKAFAKTPEGRQATAVLRRLRLEGERLDQFGGPTLDGGFARIDDFRGRVVLIAFWESQSKQFIEHLPGLISLRRKFGASRFNTVWVSLDTDRASARNFLGQNNGLTGPVILWPDVDRQGWNNPIAQYYGVRDIPMYWLIDQQGVVVDALIAPDEIEERVRSLLD